MPLDLIPDYEWHIPHPSKMVYKSLSGLLFSLQRAGRIILSQQQLNVRMKLRQSKQTPSRLRDLQTEDTPPIQQKVRHVRYAENQNEDNANFVVQFRRRTKDNQLYHSQEFLKPKSQKSLMCNQVYDNSDFFKQSLNDERDLRQGWVLTQSQQNLLQQKKPRLDSSINFRSMRPQNNLLTKSRQFLEEKQIVHEVIDDLIKKNQKSVEEFSRESQVKMCSNEDGKKAKYRMQDPDQQLYYCSKCSIMLLQKGFQVIELQPSTKSKPRFRNPQKHKHQFNQLSFKIKCLKQSLKNAIQAIESSTHDHKVQNEQIKINDVYELIISVADALRKKDLAQLKQNLERISYERSRTRASYCEKYNELQGLESQIDNLDLSIIDEDGARHMLRTFTKTVDMLQQEPSNYQMTILQQSLESRLERLVAEVKEHWPKGAIEFSFQRSQRYDNVIKEVKQPFRHLFSDDDEIKCTGFGKGNRPLKEPNSQNFLKPRNI